MCNQNILIKHYGLSMVRFLGNGNNFQFQTFIYCTWDYVQALQIALTLKTLNVKF